MVWKRRLLSLLVFKCRKHKHGKDTIIESTNIGLCQCLPAFACRTNMSFVNKHQPHHWRTLASRSLLFCCSNLGLGCTFIPLFSHISIFDYAEEFSWLHQASWEPPLISSDEEKIRSQLNDKWLSVAYGNHRGPVLEGTLLFPPVMNKRELAWKVTSTPGRGFGTRHRMVIAALHKSRSPSSCVETKPCSPPNRFLCKQTFPRNLWIWARRICFVHQSPDVSS